MDISTIVANTREVEFVHPGTGKGTGLIFHMLPPTDEKVEAAGRKVANANLKQRKFGLTVEMVDRERTERLVASIEGWDWKEDEEGEPASFGGEQLPFNEANVRKVLKAPAIRKQLLAELSEDESFFEN